MLASAQEQITEAFGLVIGQNAKTLSSRYLTNCIRDTMATVMTEFAKVNAGSQQT
ncbi:hypothetical protein [Ectopseudomonas khazarica]|uniref:hypothetical protein n=1 Tax=Ectopseudomonas khazarica TaxID=2502979 RepID=UPI003B92BE81